MKNVQIDEVKDWLHEAGEFIKTSLSDTLEVKQKEGRTDIVTNIDEETQQLLMQKIQQSYPEDQILGEEKGYTSVESMAGRVWIIDPIDGTLNFVYEQENFCIMLAIFEEGIGKFGFIYDVMRDELYWGSKATGVFKNEELLKQPRFTTLSEGLLGFNAYMYGENVLGSKKIANKSMGIRTSGCAGLEMIALLKGNHVGYVSNLAPWDYAAGMVLVEAFGYRVSALDGTPLTFKTREYLIAAQPKVHEEMIALFKQNS